MTKKMIAPDQSAGPERHKRRTYQNKVRFRVAPKLQARRLDLDRGRKLTLLREVIYPESIDQTKHHPCVSLPTILTST